MKIDGKVIADDIAKYLKTETASLTEEGVTPHLAIFQIGNDPGSDVYIRQKIKKAKEIGVQVTHKTYQDTVSEEELFTAIEDLNDNDSVHGIIIQRPVPKHITVQKLNKIVAPAKDVDAFHPESEFEPPLAHAVMEILSAIAEKEDSADFTAFLTSKNIVFVGHGEAGGKPVITHVDKLGIVYEVIDSKTENPSYHLKKADIIISAVGKRNIINIDDVKDGVILIGIGLHKEDDGKLHGDFDEESLEKKASYYTPTPGGVGPVNVIMLLSNVIEAASQSLP